MAQAHTEHLRNLQGMPARAYETTAVTMESLWGQDWTDLTLLEQLAIIADYTAMIDHEAHSDASYTECAIRYQRNIGRLNLRSYAACMLINLRAACERTR